jgi:hypothetical protein
MVTKHTSQIRMLSICFKTRPISNSNKNGSVGRRDSVDGRQITLNFYNMRTTENFGIDYIMIAIIFFYILMHWISSMM